MLIRRFCPYPPLDDRIQIALKIWRRITQRELPAVWIEGNNIRIDTAEDWRKSVHIPIIRRLTWNQAGQLAEGASFESVLGITAEKRRAA